MLVKCGRNVLCCKCDGRIVTCLVIVKGLNFRVIRPGVDIPLPFPSVFVTEVLQIVF
jgi:hypothetical protein